MSTDGFVITVIVFFLLFIGFIIGGFVGSVSGKDMVCEKICINQAYTDGEYTSNSNVCNCWNVGKPEPIKLLKGN